MNTAQREGRANQETILAKLAILRNIKSTCEKEKRLPSGDESTRANKILEDIDVLENRNAQIEEDYSRANPPDRTPVDTRADRTPMNTNPSGGPAIKRDYRSLFNSGSRSLDMGGFQSAGEFLDILGSGRYDARLQRASQVSGIPSLGGFAVPEEMTAQWLDASLPNEIVRPLCQVWPMTSDTRKIPSWDNTDQSSGELFGGFELEFIAEAATGSKQTSRMRLITLKAKKGAIFVDISSELQQDGLGFEAQLNTALQKSISHGIDRNCLVGSGSGTPQGCFNSPALISVAPEAGQVSNSIVYQNLTNMYARQLNKNNAVWLFNDTAIPSLMAITIDAGTGGSHVKVLNEDNGKFTIFGRPCYFTSIMPTVGDEHDCGFIDFSAYALGMRKEMAIDKSIAPGWTEDLVSYRIIIRFDGQGVLSSAITPENGDTLSPFVSLDARD